MGSGSSTTLNVATARIARLELTKPLDASDIASPEEAIAEVIRLRKELRRVAGKEEFKKRKEHNKWRRGSFGQIKKAEEFWERQDSLRSSPVENKDLDNGELTLDNLTDTLNKMGEEMNLAMAETPRTGKSLGRLDDRIGSFGKSPKKADGSSSVPTSRTKRRSFVLEKGLTLVDSDEDED
mmetsp:Transcript_14038/g.27994  ORF Transcript_14038/g.27994 Transcript_14038/m.27994 type:complete len:181 (+) Transcript_14038:344-886(+)